MTPPRNDPRQFSRAGHITPARPPISAAPSDALAPIADQQRGMEDELGTLEYLEMERDYCAGLGV